MKVLPDRFKVPEPPYRERRRMPVEAMHHWSPAGWANWLTDGVRLSLSPDRADRVAAFAPLTQDPDLDGPLELWSQLQKILGVKSIMALEEGLALCLAGWSWEDGAEIASYLVRLAGRVGGSAPRAALAKMLQKPHNFAALRGADKLADAVAFALSKRAHTTSIAEMAEVLEPLLVQSRSAAVLVACCQAFADPDGFIPLLKRMAPGLFSLPAEHFHWRFVVNKLVERAGSERAIEAAWSKHSGATTLKEAIAHHRPDLAVDSRPAPKRDASRRPAGADEAHLKRVLEAARRGLRDFNERLDTLQSGIGPLLNGAPDKAALLAEEERSIRQ